MPQQTRAANKCLSSQFAEEMRKKMPRGKQYLLHKFVILDKPWLYEIIWLIP